MKIKKFSSKQISKILQKKERLYLQVNAYKIFMILEEKWLI